VAIFIDVFYVGVAVAAVAILSAVAFYFICQCFAMFATELSWALATMSPLEKEGQTAKLLSQPLRELSQRAWPME